MEDFSLSGQGEIFINSSLCPFYKILWLKSTTYLRNYLPIATLLGKIVFIGWHTVRIKFNEDSSPVNNSCQ